MAERDRAQEALSKMRAAVASVREGRVDYTVGLRFEGGRAYAVKKSDLGTKRAGTVRKLAGR